MIKLIALDLDNTLLDENKNIDTETLKKLKEIQKKGIHIALVTGRIFPATWFYAKQISEHTICISYNGSTIYYKGQRLEECISQKTLSRLIEYCNHKKLFLQLYHKDRVIVDTEDWRLFRDPDLKHTEYTVIKNLFDFQPLHSPKAMIVQEPSEIPALKKDLSSYFESELIVTQSEENLIELLPINSGKKRALEKIIKKLGISRDEIMACGDNFNDIEMVDWAGVGVAVDNAVQELKEKADFITKSKNSKGVLEALLRYVSV